MKLNSQSMWFVMEAMMETAQAWTRDKMLGNDTSMNIDPSAPMIIQVGDYGYEVQSCGGDGDIAGAQRRTIPRKPRPGLAKCRDQVLETDRRCRSPRSHRLG